MNNGLLLSFSITSVMEFTIYSILLLTIYAHTIVSLKCVLHTNISNKEICRKYTQTFPREASSLHELWEKNHCLFFCCFIWLMRFRNITPNTESFPPIAHNTIRIVLRFNFFFFVNNFKYMVMEVCTEPCIQINTYSIRIVYDAYQ